MAKQEKQKESNLHQPLYFGGGKAINPVYCRTCMFSHGEPPFEDLPEKSYCQIYTRAEGEQKPLEVLFDGAQCDYYRKAKGKFEK